LESNASGLININNNKKNLPRPNCEQPPQVLFLPADENAFLFFFTSSRYFALYFSIAYLYTVIFS
jgi:hypothetical protein